MVIRSADVLRVHVVRCYRKEVDGELTSETRPAAAIKGKISVSDIFQRITFPPLRPKVICVLAVNVFSSVHGIDAVSNALFGPNQDRRLLIGSAADRQYSRTIRLPRVDWNGRIEAKNFVKMDGVSSSEHFR